jgi:radical SAM superfamily enzyme YgiQ (UPF0313 family)
MKKIVLLGSLSQFSRIWLPYPVGCIIDHCKKDNRINDMYTFLDPVYHPNCLDDASFIDKLKTVDILGLTCWIWNQTYNDKIIKLYKKINPTGIAVYGGNNVPVNELLGKKFAEERPYVDIFFCGPGEETFKNFLINLPKKGCSDVFGTYTRTEYNYIKSNRELNFDIPTPYTSGIFNNIIETATHPLCAVIETNRGCPYSCSFCDWGGITKTKISKIDVQRTKDAIDFLFSNDKISQIEIADANFGIFEQDIEYIKLMIDAKNKRKNPEKFELSYGGFAKNGSKYLPEIMTLLYDNFNSYHGRKFMKMSFQSLDSSVLDINLRTNIDNKKSIPLIKNLQNIGSEVATDIIIGMPGETYHTWLNTIQQCIDLRISHIKGFSLWVLPNTPMCDESYIKQHGLKFKNVLIPYDLDRKYSVELHTSRSENKEIHTESTFSDSSEYQELTFLYECNSFDAQELIKIYRVWFWMNTLYNTNLAKKWICQSKYSIKEQFEKFMFEIESGNLPFFKQLLDNFDKCAWDTVICPEPVTKVTTLLNASFINKFVQRAGEVVDIYLNKEKAFNELRILYPDITFDHVRDDLTNDTIKLLYFFMADLSKS